MLEINSKERSQRKFQHIIEVDKIQHLIKNYLLGQVYHLKNNIKRETININSYQGEESIEVKTQERLENHAVFYKVFNKYIEVNCTVMKRTAENIYILKVKAFKIAQAAREHLRKIVSSDSVSVSNIRAARNVINTSLFNVPTSVKIHFAQYRNEVISMADEVIVDVFDRKDTLLELVRKTSKTLYLRDTQDIVSYIPDNEDDFIDYRFHLNVRMQDVMEEYKRNKIISELIVPIIYIDHANKSISLGYFRLISKTKTIEMDSVIQLKVLAFEMVDRIRDSNTMLIEKKQTVTNISESGLLLRVEDPELKNFLLHQGGFSFDIIFKLQQPITVFTRITHTTEILNGPLLIGVHIFGHSSRKNDDIRYRELLNSLL